VLTSGAMLDKQGFSSRPLAHTQILGGKVLLFVVDEEKGTRPEIKGGYVYVRRKRGEGGGTLTLVVEM